MLITVFLFAVNVTKKSENHSQTSEFTTEGRIDVQKAKELLQSAYKDFLAIGAYSRAKDDLYFRVTIILIIEKIHR